MAKVSIIMPSLNVADYIRQCIESVVGQTLRDIEILCIDAGSTDGTLQVLQEYASHDDRIRIINADRKSYGYQMNLGVREAKGEYIGIVETDDYIETAMFEILYNATERHHADVVKAGRYELFEYEDGENLELPMEYVPFGKQTNAAFSPDDDPSIHWWEGNIWNGLYKTSFLRDHQVYFNESKGAAFQDIGFFHLAMNEAQRVVYLRNLLYHYRKVRAGASTWNSHCLENLYIEYQRLFDSGRLKNSHLSSVFRLLIPSFLYEYEKCFCYAGFDAAKMPSQEAPEWFLRVVRQSLNSGVIRLEEIPPDLRERLFLFMADREFYNQRLRNEMQKLSAWRESFSLQKGKRDLIIFGIGNYGTMMLHFLIRNGIKPIGVTDNGTDWYRNQSLLGFPIWNVDEASASHGDAFFLICNRKASNTMRKQLLDWGISGDQIGVFDGADRDVVAAMRRLPVLIETV